VSTTRFNVRFVAAHFNRAAAIDVADYWYYNNRANVRIRFDTEAEANEAAANAAAYARDLERAKHGEKATV
jgi:predicted nucleotidyltransferase component of viral defense system